MSPSPHLTPLLFRGPACVSCLAPCIIMSGGLWVMKRPVTPSPPGAQPAPLSQRRQQQTQALDMSDHGEEGYRGEEAVARVSPSNLRFVISS
uniref:Secreted protein n=1 Tax=Knipowitschia caucasica TaxID=637954 RepID=A0AAV2JIQ5_KNICA